MTIFERLKQKANQALQSVGNFIDRDKANPGIQLFRDRDASMPGNQVIPGGFQGGVERVKQSFRQDPGQYSITRPISNVANRILDQEVGGYQLRDQIKAYPQAFMQNLPITPDRQENFNRNVQDIFGERTPVTTIAQGFNNWFSAPLMQVPYNAREAIGGEDKSLLSRAGHGAQALFGLLPGIDDAAFAGYNALKGAATERSKAGLQPGLAGNEYFGLGDAITGGQDTSLSAILNTAELPLLLFGGIKAKNLDEVLQSQLKQADNLSFLKQAKGADELVQPLKTAENTIFVTPGGTAIKPKVQPKSTASLEKILQQAEEVIPGGSKQADDIGGLLSAGKQTPELPANAESVINTQKQGDSFFKSWKGAKDVNAFDRIRLSRQERLDKSLPANVYNKIKTNVVDVKNKLLADSIDWGKKYENMLSQLPIKMGSNEDKLIRQLNSGEINEKQLIEQVGEAKASQIFQAHDMIRGMYDEMINFVNPRRAEAGLDQIPFRENFLSQVGNRKSGNLIDSLLGGDKTTNKFSSAIFQKQGEAADFGAIEGMVNYLDYIKRAGFTDLVTPKLDEYIGIARKAGANERVVNYLENYRDTILGIKDIGLGDKLQKATGSIRGSAVLGNVRSLVAQTYNLPQAIAEANPINFMKGLVSKEAKVAEKQSALLKSLDEKTPMSLLQGWDKIKKPAADALQEANNFTARKVWRSFFEQGKSKGVDDAIQYADDLTVQLMGDRRLGELGEYYESWMGKVFSPFTLENQAAMNTLFRNVGQKKVGKVLGTIFAWHFANDVIERAGTGDRPFFDPIAMVGDVAEQLTGSEEKSPDAMKAAGRVISEVTNLFPALQSPMFTAVKLGEMGINSAIPGEENDISTRDLFGTEDPTWMNTLSLYNPLDLGRNVTGNKAVDIPLNLASKVTPYTNQLARTLQAGKSLSRGYAESRKGNPMYEMPTNPIDQGRALLFGQNATPQAQKMFDNEFDWGLYGKQADTIKNIPSKEGKVEYLQNARKKNVAKNQLEAMLSGKGGSVTGGDSDSISLAAFDGKKATSPSIEERMDVYKGLNSIINDDTLPDEYKDQAIKASGADEKDVLYYNLASKDVDVKLQEMLPVMDSMSDEDLFQYLAEGRKVIGGKQLVTTTMIDYLYDRDYISKGQKDALKALKFDEINNEFYYKKSYSGGGSGGKLTYKQALNLFQVDLPKYSALKSMSSIINSYDAITSGASQTDRSGETLLEDILRGNQ